MKKILALLLAVLMIVGLTACGGASDDPKDEVKEYTIKVWTPAEDQAEGNNWLVKMEEKFAAAHPEWKINWTNESLSEGDAAGTVTADITASADIYMFANDQLGNLITAGGLTKLGGKFETQVKTDNTDFMINTVTHTDGGVYGFPVTSNTWFMYYNKDVFSEEDVKSLDTMLTKGKVALPMTVSWYSGCFFLGCGGTVFGTAGNDAAAGIQFGEANGGYIAAHKMVELINHSNVIAAGGEVGKLIDGEVAASFSGSWDYTSAKNALGDKLGVTVLPKFTAEGKEYQMKALSGSKCVGVNPNSGSVEGKQLVCTEFAAFLASEEAQMERYNMRNVVPAAKNLQANDTIKNDPVAQAEIATINNASVVQSALPEMANYWDPLNTYANQIVSGEIHDGNCEEYVDTMMTQMNKK